MGCRPVGTSRRHILCLGEQECSTNTVELNVFTQLRNAKENNIEGLQMTDWLWSESITPYHLETDWAATTKST